MDERDSQESMFIEKIDWTGNTGRRRDRWNFETGMLRNYNAESKDS
jgi:hypothetical protein